MITFRVPEELKLVLFYNQTNFGYYVFLRKTFPRKTCVVSTLSFFQEIVINIDILVRLSGIHTYLQIGSSTSVKTIAQQNFFFFQRIASEQIFLTFTRTQPIERRLRFNFWDFADSVLC